MFIHKFSQKEMQDFYDWLVNHEGLSHRDSYRYVCTVNGVEKFTYNQGYSSKKLFSFDQEVVFATVSELLADTKFTKKYVSKYRDCPVSPASAVLKLVEYASDVLTPKLPVSDNAPEWKDSYVLYVHKGFFPCQQKKHNVISATARLLDSNNERICLNAKFCTECKKFFINVVSYEDYRKKYGALLGSIEFEDSEKTINDTGLADESLLHKCGYSVNKKDNYSDVQRRYIIASVICFGLMTKPQVITYLESFIKRNGLQERNDDALYKWRKDLEFTRNYDMENDPVFGIKMIKKL